MGLFAMIIRRARFEDRAQILEILLPVIRAGETYALDRDMPASDLLNYWFGPDKETFVAEDDGVLLGTYYLRPNQAGGGGHVCNCGYMTASSAAGRGVGQAMCEHSLDHAVARGFLAMQFNFVVSTNDRAVALWTRMGFNTLCRLPRAFHHPKAGFVDALVMFRELPQH